MKKSIIALSLLVAGMCSCNSDEELIKKNPGYMEDGYAGLTIRMDFPSATTKAVGDPLTDVAYATEKKISSVAFFVKTNDEGIGVNLKPGAFCKFFSTDDLFSANGLNKPLVNAKDGEYTASIKIKSDGWSGNTQVIVIANYAENGLTDKLKDVGTWENLKDIQSNDLTSNPTTPLLMYGTKEVQMTNGDTKELEFMMERLVSRVDILNNASNTEASKGFVLTSAQFVNPKQYTFLLPNNDKSVNIPVVNTDFKAHTPESATPGKIDSLYTYEHANDGTTAQTAIRVNGTFKGAPVSKVIDFRQVNEAGVQTDPIVLSRNRRYLININPTPDSTDVVWTVKVAEWENGDVISIQPSTKIPEITGLPENGELATGATWDKATQTITLDGTYAGDAALNFTAACSQSSDFKLGFKYNTGGSSFGLDKLENVEKFVKQEAPVVSYATTTTTTVTRKYTLTIPAQTVNVPADVYVRIVNSMSNNACDTIRIISRPNYDNTISKPVLMLDGKFWAPVNVGATEIPTSVSTTGDVTSTCGKLFQWGRKASLPGAGGTASGSAATNPIQSDLETMEENLSWKDLFILSKAKGPDTKGNWLIINPTGDNPADAEMKDAWYQTLWNATAVMDSKKTTATKTTADPCPIGWRVPTIGDWEALGTGEDNVKDKKFSGGILTIPGVGGIKLVLPAAGIRNGDTGDSEDSEQGAAGYYWTSSVPSGDAKACYVSFAKEILNSLMTARANGLSVRCVQE